MTVNEDERSSAYHVGARTLAIVYQDLATVEADVIVSSDDSRLTMSGGVSARLRDAGGPCVSEHVRKFVTPSVRSPIERGDVVVTTAGALPARYLFHAITINLEAGTRPNEEAIERATARCMALAESLGMASIAFPALGTGVGGFPFQAAAKSMIRAITVGLDTSEKVERATIALLARQGVREHELQAFYEDAVGQIALWQQTRRVAASLDQLVASGSVPQDVATGLRSVLGEVRATEERLDTSGSAGEAEGAASLVNLGQRIGSALSELRSRPAQDSQTQGLSARAELEELRFEWNAQKRLLIRFEKDRAMGGPSDRDSEQQIAEARQEMENLSARIAAIERRFPALAGTQE